MSDLDPRTALDTTAGETPTPEFVERLRSEIDRELAGQSDGIRTVTSDVPVVDAVLDEGNEPMGRNRLTGILVAAAAIVIVVVGIVVVTNDDADTTVEPPPRTEDVAAPTSTTISTTTATEPPQDWSFDVSYIEIDDESAFGVLECCGLAAVSDDVAWVIDGDLDQFNVVDLATNTVLSPTPVLNPGILIWPGYGFDSVWIGSADNTLRRVDAESGAVTATIDVGSLGWVEGGTDSVWVAAGQEVVRVDPNTNTIAARIPLDTESTERVEGSGEMNGGYVAENADGVWMRDQSGRIHRIDPATDTVVATIDTATWDTNGSGSITAGEEGIWADGGPSGSLYRIDPDTNTVSAEVIVEVNGERTSRVWQASVGGGSVWVRYGCDAGVCNGIARIDPETDAVVATVELRDGWGNEHGVTANSTSAFVSGPKALARIDF